MTKKKRPVGRPRKYKPKELTLEEAEKKSEKKAADYEKKKEKSAEREKLMSMAGRDIGKIPDVFNQERRDACEFNLKLFLETYLPVTFNKPWSEGHLTAIAKSQRAILKGGTFALAMPRGEGKTSLTEGTTLWALLYGHRKFAAVIGSDEDAAREILTSIKSELEHNQLLLEDFPEVCVPIAAIDGASQRTQSQLCEGIRTEMRWKDKEIFFPTISGSPSSGSGIKTAGITGRVRGMKRKLVNGVQQRPDLVIVDDPQTKESAASPSQVAKRLEILAGDVLGLAGPGESIAGFMPCTVIAENDMADQILNPSLYPEWQGQRTKMVIKFPKNIKLWEKYEEIYYTSFKLYDDFRLATDFYKENYKAMSEGAIVSWESRFTEYELDAIQHAMNLKIRDENAFWAEYQNEPISREKSDVLILTSNEIVLKLNGHPRYEVPFGCDKVTVGVDVQGKFLAYAIAAWEPNGTGYLIDYGAYPDQKRDYFTRKDAKIDYLGKAKGGFEADLFLALEIFVPTIMDREFITSEGIIFRVDQMLIDANWEKSKNPIYQYCRTSPYGNNVLPSHGRFYGAIKTPMSDRAHKQGESRGTNWILTYPKTTQTVRYIIFDTNYWKTWIHQRLLTGMGGHGCFSFFGKNPKPIRMIADHLTAEYVTLVKAKDREVEEWNERVGSPDNEGLDTTVLCSVGASMRGIALGTERQYKSRTKSTKSMSEIIAERRKNRGG